MLKPQSHFKSYSVLHLNVGRLEINGAQSIETSNKRTEMVNLC